MEEGFFSILEFSYSQEEGTPAAIFENQVDDAIKRRAKSQTYESTKKDIQTFDENQAWTDMQC